MRANAEEVPYTFLRGEAAAASRWAFAPLYAPLQPLLAQAAELLAIHRRPREERNTMLEVRVCACALCVKLEVQPMRLPGRLLASPSRKRSARRYGLLGAAACFVL